MFDFALMLTWILQRLVATLLSEVAFVATTTEFSVIAFWVKCSVICRFCWF